jgi:hypothetical protein
MELGRTRNIIGGAGTAGAFVGMAGRFGRAGTPGYGETRAAHHALKVFGPAFFAFHFHFIVARPEQDFFFRAAVRALEFIYGHGVLLYWIYFSFQYDDWM